MQQQPKMKNDESLFTIERWDRSCWHVWP